MFSGHSHSPKSEESPRLFQVEVPARTQHRVKHEPFHKRKSSYGIGSVSSKYIHDGDVIPEQNSMFEDSFLEDGPTFEQQIDSMNTYLQPGQVRKARPTN